ncbi:uncharacterized protein LOC113214181 isoform X4 [Frankliniella occidentalis]|uniref:Uncharacterized protein LOC113214181 isoform X4 n=1 Tax=Frankliniella occidentalis TaxID=133901 RepID=A0A9C6X6J2_FRAOC|nr:uncharacterized protein LOC113214181 isoform X4 [Frankliniella occidentalis]
MEKRRGGAEEVMSPVPDPPQAEEPQPTRHASTASLSLELLPDDALLLVLRYLDVPSLLTCRLVCRRLGVLVLHHEVWRHREIGGYGDRTCMCPQLRLAPCVRLLYVFSELNQRVPCRWAALAWTRCAAAEVRLRLLDDAASTYATAVALIFRQEALGRLRSLAVSSSSKKASKISLLMATASSTPGLEKLELIVYESSLPTHLQLDCSIMAPSLRHFKCNLCHPLEPYANFIVAGHAATLETVDLGSEASSMACAAIVPLLVGLPKLTKLSCSNIPGVEVMAARDSLRDLELTVMTETEHRGALAGAAALLRRASQLQKVTVYYSPGTPDVRVDVVRALASSRRSRVESLQIHNYGDNDDDDGQYFCHLQELITAMPSLPILRRLCVDVGGSMEKLDELALAITPDTTPALRTVYLGLGEGPCGHAWLHRDANCAGV